MQRCSTGPSNPCPGGIPNAKCVVYTGGNLTNINVVTNDRLDVILQRINNALSINTSLYTDNTPSLTLSGSGTQINPLSGDVNISAFPGNAIIIRPDGIYSTNVIEKGVVYGGIVTWLQDYDYHVSAAGYYINGIFYESPAINFTLSPPDGTFNRIDTFILDTTANASVLEGTPSSNPAQAPLDLATQLEISVALVETGTTQPTIDAECAYKNNAEWTATSSNSSLLNPDSTNNPCNGTKSIEATNVTNGVYLQLERGSTFAPAFSYSQVTLYLKSKGNFGNASNGIRLQFTAAGSPVGAAVEVRHGLFGFDSTDIATCQIIGIPISNFGLTSLSTIDGLRITAILVSGTIGFFIDDLCMQGQPVPNFPASPDEKFKISSNDTTPGFWNQKILAGTGITLTENNDGGNETITISAAVANTFQNGLTESSNVVELGGTLLHSTTINSNTYPLNITGSVSGDSFTVTNSAAGVVSAITATASDASATGINGIGGNIGVAGSSTAGAGGRFSATSGIGVSASATSGLAGLFQTTSTATNTATDVITIQKFTTGTPAANIGAIIDIGIETDGGGTAFTSTQLISRLSTATHASRSGQFEIWNVNSAVLDQQFTLKSTGQLQLNNYTGATFSGTPTSLLGVEADGDIVEVGFLNGLAANNGLILSGGNTVQLGGTGSAFLSNRSIETSAFSLTLNSTNTSRTLLLNNTSSGRGLEVVASSGNAGTFTTTTGANAIIATNNDSTGTAITATGGLYGLIARATSSSAIPLQLENDYTGNGLGIIAEYQRSAISSPAANDGMRFIYGGAATYMEQQLVFTDVTPTTRNGRYIINLLNEPLAGSVTNKLILDGTGYLELSEYGLGNITGTPTFGAAFDASGKLIEIALGGAGFTNPMTATGDIIYSSDGAGTPAALPVATNGDVLTLVGGLPAWVTPGVGGTVTSVAAAGTGIYSFSGSPVTTSGTLTLTTTGTSGGGLYFSNGTTVSSTGVLAANALMIGGGAGTAYSTTTTGTGVLTALGVNTGSAGAFVVNGGALGTPSSGTLTNATGLPIVAGTTGTLTETRGGTNQSTYTAGDLLYASALNTLSKLGIGTSGQVLRVSVGGVPEWGTITGTGTVTSVNVSGGSTGLTFSGGPITGSGTITMAGTLDETFGGTGNTSYVTGDLLYASASNTLSKRAIGSANQVLVVSGGVPTWGQVNLAFGVTGDLPFSNMTSISGKSVVGVAGNASADMAPITATLADQVLRVNSTNNGIGWGAINLASATTVGASILPIGNGGTGVGGTYTNGQLLIGNGTGLTKATLTAGSGISITNGAGSITISNGFNAARQTLTDASTIVWNINNGEAAVVTLGNINRTLSITNPVAGRTYILEIIQDGSGNRTISTWPTGTTWSGGTPVLSTAPGAVDVATFYYTGSGYRALFNAAFV